MEKEMKANSDLRVQAQAIQKEIIIMEEKNNQTADYSAVVKENERLSEEIRRTNNDAKELMRRADNSMKEKQSFGS